MSSSSPEIAPEAAELLRLLADPTRLKIFLLVMEGEICNCELSESLNLPQKLVSHHLRRLREAGLVVAPRPPRRALGALHRERRGVGTRLGGSRGGHPPIPDRRAGSRLPRPIRESRLRHLRGRIPARA